MSNTDKNIAVRFYDEGGPGASQARLSGKIYSFKSSQDIKVDDVVIVRTYDPKNGPLRFAKVQAVGGPILGSTGYEIKRVIQVLDTAAADAEEQREKDLEAVQKMLKQALAARSQLELFREVGHTLSETDRALAAQVLGINPEELKPQATEIAGKINEVGQQHDVEVVYTRDTTKRWTIPAASLDDAIRKVGLAHALPEHMLTARYI